MANQLETVEELPTAEDVPLTPDRSRTTISQAQPRGTPKRPPLAPSAIQNNIQLVQRTRCTTASSENIALTFRRYPIYTHTSIGYFTYEPSSVHIWRTNQ
eukprot:7723134-Pyramimonas_sp.AAC.1